MDLKDFQQEWVDEYVAERQRTIALFDPAARKNLSLARKQQFFLLFDPLRREFTGLLGHLCGLAPNQNYKRVLLQNWMEENGVAVGYDPGLKSHDYWYAVAARAVGVDIGAAVLAGKTGSFFSERFNDSFYSWMIRNIETHGLTDGWEIVWSGYCAYELLDNVDYPAFLEMVKEYGMEGADLTFFEIHCDVEHYDQGRHLLEDIWKRNPQHVREGFAFIRDLQLQAFAGLSLVIFTSTGSNS